MNFETLIERLRESRKVDGLLFLGSTGQPTLNSFSDRDLLIVLNERELPITSGTVYCDGILVDLIFATRQEIEELSTEEPDSISLSDRGASFFNWIPSGVVALDKSGCLASLRDAIMRSQSRPRLSEGESVNRVDHAIYNLAQTQRMSSSPDPVYQLAIDLRMLYQLSDLTVDYFNLRGLPWRGEKEAVRYWQSFDVDYFDLFMRCYWEQDRTKRVRLYGELVNATTAPIGYEWDADGPNFVLSPPTEMTDKNLLIAQRFWQSLMDG